MVRRPLPQETLCLVSNPANFFAVPGFLLQLFGELEETPHVLSHHVVFPLPCDGQGVTEVFPAMAELVHGKSMSAPSRLGETYTAASS